MSLRFTPKSALGCALTGGSVTLLVASLLPIWTLWYENPWEGVGYPVTLWTLVWELWKNALTAPNPAFPVTCRSDESNQIVLAVTFAVGAIVGLGVRYFRAAWCVLFFETPGASASLRLGHSKER